MATLDTIGARTHVLFPTDSGQTVPAKVDTGADYSSIWASNIREENGTLFYTLFAPGSPYYSGKEHTTTEYEITRVKNSFGHVENRYIIRLAMKIEGRRIRASVSLADRSKNRYPILIGRKTLSGKFLVDTRLRPRNSSDDSIKILMLNVASDTSIVDFADNIQNHTENLKCDFLTYDDMMIFISENTVEIRSLKSNAELGRYDLVYFKTHQRRQEFAGALSTVFDIQGIQYIDREIQQHTSNSKLTQYIKLHRDGLLLPKTVLFSAKRLEGNYKTFKDFLGLPFILKDPEADKGLRNYLIEDEADYNRVTTKTSDRQLYVVGQEFIPNEGDLRVLVFGKKAELIIGRKSSSTHLNNTSAGGQATLIDATSDNVEVRRLAVKAAVALNRQVAGVDLIQHTGNGKWYILEVNNSPQLAGGAYIDKKLTAFGAFLRRYADK